MEIDSHNPDVISTQSQRPEFWLPEIFMLPADICFQVDITIISHYSKCTMYYVVHNFKWFMTRIRIE